MQRKEQQHLFAGPRVGFLDLFLRQYGIIGHGPGFDLEENSGTALEATPRWKEVSSNQRERKKRPLDKHLTKSRDHPSYTNLTHQNS